MRLRNILLPLIALLAALFAPHASRAAEPVAAEASPWNLAELRTAPKVQWLESKDGVAKVLYAGEPYRGKPTRVFAYVGRPAAPAGAKVPGMVLVHGGGGAAFPQWVRLWTERGYAAIAMDMGGKDADKKPLPDGGPDQGHVQKFDDIKNGLKDCWCYHAVANVILAHSLLRSLPEVDAERTGVTGISWGGYLTCMVAGLDDRFKLAIPVYGCGFLNENSTWLGEFKKIGPASTALWTRHFDPSAHLPNARMPMLWVNGTNDFAYPLDSYQKSYRAAKGERTLCVTVRMPHGHEAGWAPKEIGAYADSVFKAGPALPRMGPMRVEGARVLATFAGAIAPVKAALHHTPDTGPWKDRKWQTLDAKIQGDAAAADLPAAAVYFMTITDARGLTVSTEHATAGAK